MPQVASEKQSALHRKASVQLALSARLVMKHSDHLKTVLKSLASFSSLHFLHVVHEAQLFKECVSLDLLAETWHGCVHSATRASTKVAVPEKCIEATLKLLDGCAKASRGDTQSVRYCCEALGNVARARLPARSPEAQTKLFEVMEKFCEKDSKVMESCLWALIKLSKNYFFGLHISQEQLLCEPSNDALAQDEQLLRYISMCANPVPKLCHQLSARRHSIHDIKKRLFECRPEDIKEVFFAILDDAEYCLWQPTQIFMDANDGDERPDQDGWMPSQAERDWAKEVLNALVAQRIALPPDVAPLTLQWAKSAKSWDCRALRRRFLIVGALFGEATLLGQLKQQGAKDDACVAAIRALMDVKQLHAFNPKTLSEGLTALLDIDVDSCGALASAMAGGMATSLFTTRRRKISCASSRFPRPCRRPTSCGSLQPAPGRLVGTLPSSRSRGTTR